MRRALVRVFRACLISAALLSVRAFGAEARFELPTLETEIFLTGALFNESPSPEGPTLVMEVNQYGDRWERVWGVARSYNIGIHNGLVASAAVTDTTINLKLVVKIERDAWVKGGRAVYDINLQRAKDGKLEGQFTGTFKGQSVQGRAFGLVKPPAKLAAGYVPVQPGEHPRILFRKHELPKLREKAQTELGKPALAAMGSTEGRGDAIGLGVKWQITGEKRFADLAQQSTARHMADTSVPAFAPGRQWGPRIEQIAVAYDLCCDAWPADFSRKVESYLRFVGYQVFYDKKKLGESINWNVGSNYAGPIFAGAGFAGLALWGEKGPEPLKPEPPGAVEVVPPARDYQPPKGVPIAKLVLGRGAGKWMVADPFPFGMSNDPMVSLGGMEELRPEPGTEITVDGQTARFAPMDAKHVAENGCIALRTGLKQGRALTLFAYTVYDVAEPRTVKLNAFATSSGRVQVALNGVRLAHDQVVKLEKGLYPMLLVLRLGTDWATVNAWFDEAAAEDVQRSAGAAAARRAEYEEMLKDWEFDRREWQRLGGADVNYLRLFDMGRRMMYLFCREACGTGGYQTESGHYFNDGIDGPGRYASAFLNMFGRNVSSFGDISHYIPRLIFARVYFPDGKSHGLNISSSIGPNGARCADMFPIIPDEWKAAVLWHWNRGEGGGVAQPDLAKIAQDAPVQAFLHYPLQMKPRPPGEAMPLTWEAPTFGYYGFRNAWKDQNDIVFQVFAKAKGPGGWGGPDAGTFRLMGLGHAWAVGNTGREVRRWLENVVVLTEDADLTESSLGRVTHLRSGADGSGAVSIDLTDLGYKKSADKDKPLGPSYETYGGIRHPPTVKPVVSSLRAVAVDYSGRSGAPCLLALVDRIEGGKSKEWMWQVPNLDAVKTAGNTFTITAGNASLRGTFVSPAPVSLVASRDGRKTTKSAGHMAGKEITLNLSAVTAQGEADPNDGRFFLVATLQRGEPPPVKATGQGLDARVRVGKCQVRFDGGKLLIEDAP
jgi:hypothetical protein